MSETHPTRTGLFASLVIFPFTKNQPILGCFSLPTWICACLQPPFSPAHGCSFCLINGMTAPVMRYDLLTRGAAALCIRGELCRAFSLGNFTARIFPTNPEDSNVYRSTKIQGYATPGRSRTSLKGSISTDIEILWISLNRVFVIALKGQNILSVGWRKHPGY